MTPWILAAALLALTMLLMSTAQNDWCLPWQERVGIDARPFSGVEGATRCR